MSLDSQVSPAFSVFSNKGVRALLLGLDKLARIEAKTASPNRQRTRSLTRRALITASVAVTFAISLTGQTTASSLPFVGCVSYGQRDKTEAPEGTSVVRPFARHDAAELAYYQSDQIRLVAPKGWNCEGYSDSSGRGMLLSPEPKREPRWSNFAGPAIVLNYISGETGSGRLQIAEAASRIFPAFRAWAARNVGEFYTDLPQRPYPTDHLRYRSSRIVEFETPPGRKGFGNDFSQFVPNDKPTFGVAILMRDPSEHMLVMTIRLPSNLQSLLPLIVKDVEEHKGEN